LVEAGVVGVGQAGLLGDHDGVAEVAHDGVVELGNDQASLLVELVLAFLFDGAGLEAVMADDLTDHHTRNANSRCLDQPEIPRWCC
jgi:hypothetical protein